MKRSRGMTLVELLLTTTLLSLVASGVVFLLTYANQERRIVRERSALVRETYQVSSYLSEQFRSFGSRRRSISDSACYHRSAFDSVRTFRQDPEGYPDWRSWIGYRLDGSRQLVEERSVAPSGVQLAPLDDVSLDQTRVILGGVNRLDISPVGTHSVRFDLDTGTEQEGQTYTLYFTAGQRGAL